MRWNYLEQEAPTSCTCQHTAGTSCPLLPPPSLPIQHPECTQPPSGSSPWSRPPRLPPPCPAWCPHRPRLALADRPTPTSGRGARTGGRGGWAGGRGGWAPSTPSCPILSTTGGWLLEVGHYSTVLGAQTFCCEEILTLHNILSFIYIQEK